METDLNNMTMRDLFAAFAMIEMIMNKELPDRDTADLAYNFADYMLERREEL
jgi:hypothetical protein